MGAIDDLAKLLADPARPGLTPELIAKLNIPDEAQARARLQAQAKAGPIVAYHLLAAWVEDCRDAVGDGEVYWWAIPMMGHQDGSVRWSALNGIPTGAEPTSVGSRKWLPSLSLKAPPLLGVVAPDATLSSFVLRLAFYEDDWAKARVADALRLGLQALGGVSAPSGGVEPFVQPIRKPIWDELKAKQDDYMLEQDVKFQQPDGEGFGAGEITSLMSQYIRIYLIARDVELTEVCGPFTLTKGQQQRLLFPSSLEARGRLTIFAKGAANAGRFGMLDVDTPFAHIAVAAEDVAGLASGVTITAEADTVEVIGYYTPPRPA